MVSGCSKHMATDKVMLSQFVEKDDPLVTFRNNNQRYTMRYENLEIESVIIMDVALVEGIKHNLLSIGQFINRGFKFKFGKDKYLIFKRQLVMFYSKATNVEC